MMKKPPEGVSLRYADGTTYDNLPLEYVGIEDGIHTWQVLAPRDERPVQVLVDYWPAKTAIVFPLLEGMDHEDD